MFPLTFIETTWLIQYHIKVVMSDSDLSFFFLFFFLQNKGVIVKMVNYLRMIHQMKNIDFKNPIMSVREYIKLKKTKIDEVEHENTFRSQSFLEDILYIYLGNENLGF